MSGEINVLSRQQTIIVEPVSSSVSVINAGPVGISINAEGKTGILIVSDVTLIPFDKLEPGTLAFQTQFSAVGEPGLYVLKGGIDVTNWTRVIDNDEVKFLTTSFRYAIQRDWVIDSQSGASVLYVGKAPFASATWQNVWNIQKFIFNGQGGIAQTAWSKEDAIWDDHLNEEYTSE